MARTSEDRKRGTAYHEAGHAVLSWVLDLPVQTVHIEYNEADDLWGGGTDLKEGHDDSHLSFEARVEIRSAGHAAEIVSGHRGEEIASIGDLVQIRNLRIQERIPESEERRVIRDGDIRATAHVKELQHLVTKLAERLFEKERIECNEFLQLMNEKMPVSTADLRQRVDIALKLRGQRLHTAVDGRNHIVSALHADLVHIDVDYYALVRELGVLKPWEKPDGTKS